MHETTTQAIGLMETLQAFLIPLGCFAIVLLLLRFAAKASWLTSIAAALVIAKVPSILGIHILGCSPFMPFYPGWLNLLLPAIGAIILVIQFFRWLFTLETTHATVNTSERSRIIKLVEDGKISSDEGTELLDAMGRSNALQGQDKFSRLDIAMLFGIALVILGFFLPWVYLGNKMYQAGHHRGPVGWAVLIVAILASVPIFVTPKEMLYKISMLQIFLVFVGLALVIKELTVGADQIGTIFCTIGFFLTLLGSGFKLKGLAA